LVPLPASLIWFDGKMNGEVIPLHVDTGDMNGDQLLVVE
jgi:hypothetical protein